MHWIVYSVTVVEENIHEIVAVSHVSQADADSIAADDPNWIAYQGTNENWNANVEPGWFINIHNGTLHEKLKLSDAHEVHRWQHRIRSCAEEFLAQWFPYPNFFAQTTDTLTAPTTSADRLEYDNAVDFCRTWCGYAREQFDSFDSSTDDNRDDISDIVQQCEDQVIAYGFRRFFWNQETATAWSEKLSAFEIWTINPSTGAPDTLVATADNGTHWDEWRTNQFKKAVQGEL